MFAVLLLLLLLLAAPVTGQAGQLSADWLNSCARVAVQAHLERPSVCSVWATCSYRVLCDWRNVCNIRAWLSGTAEIFSALLQLYGRTACRAHGARCHTSPGGTYIIRHHSCRLAT